MKKDFYDSQAYSITNYLISYIQVSFYLIICNILPIIYLFLSISNPDIFGIAILFITLIPTGASIGALYSIAGRCIREKDMFFASQYFKYYKANFKSCTKFWVIILALLFLLLFDYEFFSIDTSSGMYMIFVLLAIVLGLICLYAFPINSRFEISVKDLFLTSIYYMIKNMPYTFLKVVILFLFYTMFKRVSIFLVLFVPTALCFILMFYDNNMLKEIEEKTIKE
ncbi:DUF624 domain-containing protein [Clostridium sp. SM-530-WT-3G]|uniref:DUF624 domain-containing protein n=1 Tax=Clostridium sp. SM-530-WT-3G TaxID=2725303 RepID=UPI00145D150D|nr:DUF624 domain-containing protein [Clostridium sp. SM-530-WT-3G]NME84141.1 DUF624 domain-containing protein [Clostridium sp. SM-530-WT-3G]